MLTILESVVIIVAVFVSAFRFIVVFRGSLWFKVIFVSIFVSVYFLLRILARNFNRICSNLINRASGSPRCVYRFVNGIIFLSLLRELVSMFTYRRAYRFTCFLNRGNRVNRFTRMACAVHFGPTIRFFLYFFRYRCSLFLISVRVMAKPLFEDSAFVSTPGSPIPASLPEPVLDS